MAGQAFQFLDFPQRIAEKLFDAVIDDIVWSQYLSGFDPNTNKLHIAVMLEPYLGLCLEGRKTIESRFSTRRIAPYRQVRSGDVILMKRPGAALVGVCGVSDTWFYELDPTSWQKIKTGFIHEIYAEPDFWVERENAAFATLIRIKHARPIKPIDFTKRDMRGWVALSCKAGAPPSRRK